MLVVQINLNFEKQNKLYMNDIILPTKFSIAGIEWSLVLDNDISIYCIYEVKVGDDYKNFPKIGRAPLFPNKPKQETQQYAPPPMPQQSYAPQSTPPFPPVPPGYDKR